MKRISGKEKKRAALAAMGALVLGATLLFSACGSKNSPATPSGPAPTPTFTPTVILTPPGTWVTFGTGAAGQIVGLTVDSASPANVYVADQSIPAVVKYLAPAGSNTWKRYTTYSVSNPPTPAATSAFNSPWGVAWAPNPSGEIYATDEGNTSFPLVGIGGRDYSLPGEQTASVAVDQSTRCNGGPCIYVANSTHGKVYVLDQNDGNAVTTYTTYPGGSFNQPWGVAVNSAGTTLVVEDAGNHNIVQIDNNTAQIFTHYSFSGTTYALASSLAFIALDATGNIYFSDNAYNRVVELNPSGGTVEIFSAASGIAFNGPWGVAVDSSNNLYVVDSGNGRIMEYLP